MKLEEIKNSKTFCFYPYLQLSTVPSGFLKPCCFYEDVLTDANDTKLKVDKNNLESVWNSDGID